MRKIYMYQTATGLIPVLRFINTTNAKIQNKFKFMVQYISDEKNVLCEPYVKHFSIQKYKSLYELRIRAKRTMVRVIFYETDDTIILLHAFYKRDKKDCERALEHALKLVKTLKAEALYPTENLMEVNIG